MRLALDPGHGGESTGAVGNGIVEKDWCLSFCRLVAARISSCELPEIADILLTRNSDVDVSLLERGAQTNAWDADLVISVHVNAHPSPSIAGAMAFHWPGNDRGQAVGGAIMRAVPSPLHRKRNRLFAATDDPAPDDNWLQRPRNVLAPHNATAVLVEAGYLSNEFDSFWLLEPAVQDGLAFAAICGVLEFARKFDP